MVRDYLCDRHTPDEELSKPFVALAMGSVARMCVIPLQDYLGYDNACRINKPSTVGENWRWRVTAEELTQALQADILAVTRRYGRTNWS